MEASLLSPSPTLFLNPSPPSSSSTHHSKSLSFPLKPFPISKSNLQTKISITKSSNPSRSFNTFLKEEDSSSSSSKSKSSIAARFEKMILEAQDSICKAIEEVDEGGKFEEDLWEREGGGGGISRVLQKGNVWEKAGVNVSVVYGNMPPDAYRAARDVVKDSTSNDIVVGNCPVPFFAAGISSVLHPKNPFAPTLHFNYRYFEMDAPKGMDGAPKQWWFGGGTDLTPSYIFEEDVKHFHMVQKTACDKFDPEFYPRFKNWCDDYFYIKHRGERRGVGGIFFDDLNGHDQEMLLAFSTECANSVVPAYIPIIKQRKDTPFIDQNKEWQMLRRGRYVEFNLIYDRGTSFGLKTGGRIESILVSMPLEARWEYNHQPEDGSEERKLLDVCINPKDWI